MDELLVNLNTILQEKEEKILPKNIKKDIEIFGVIGTLEGKSGSEYNATLKSPTNRTSFEARYWLSEIDVLDLTGVTSLHGSFKGCSVLTKISNILNSSGVTTMRDAFNGCSVLTSLPDFDTSNVTDMYGAFWGCKALIKAPSINTSKVTIMYQMFSMCSALTSVPELDTVNVTNMTQAFANCTALTTLPNFNASKLNTIHQTFYNCKALTTFGGFTNLGMAYTQKTANYGNYKLDLSASTQLTHDSLMNVINKLYDLNLTYNIAGGGTLYAQQLVLGSTNLSKLTAEEIRNSNSEAVGLLVNNKKGGNRYEFF